MLTSWLDFVWIGHAHTCEEEEYHIFRPMQSLRYHHTGETKVAKSHKQSCEEPTIDPHWLLSYPWRCKDTFSTTGNILVHIYWLQVMHNLSINCHYYDWTIWLAISFRIFYQKSRLIESELSKIQVFVAL